MSGKANNINSSGCFRTCSRKSLTITCGDGSIAVKAVTLDITGFSRLHSTCLIERKGRNAYVETYRGYIWG